MRQRAFVSLATPIMVILGVSLAQVSAGQSLASAPDNWTMPRTPDGQPSLEGVWSNNGTTPLERPEIFEGRTELTDEEVAQIRSRANDILNGTNEQAGDVLGDSLYRQAVEDPTLQRFDAVTGNYNTFWIADRSFDNRTSLIVDPPTGRMPPLTEEALAGRAAAAGGFARLLNPHGPEDTGLTVRCISYGMPNLLTGYNSYFQILQSPTHVIILQELIHDARVVPLDGRPHLDDGIRQLHGDSRGHWEGDTLVVETTNYSGGGGLRGGSDGLRVEERFTRIGPDMIRWDVTYEDPSTWTQPWTAMIALNKSEGAVFEYACHEGNYAMEGILAGARALDAAEEVSPDLPSVAEVPPLPVIEAPGFLGEWAVAIQGPTGAIEQDLLIADVNGHVVAEVAIDGMEEPQVITRIVKTDAGLVLDYDLVAFGQTLPVSTTLGLDGETLTVVIAVADGQFSLEGTGVRK